MGISRDGPSFTEATAARAKKTQVQIEAMMAAMNGVRAFVTIRTPRTAKRTRLMMNMVRNRLSDCSE